MSFWFNLFLQFSVIFYWAVSLHPPEFLISVIVFLNFTVSMDIFKIDYFLTTFYLLLYFIEYIIIKSLCNNANT